MRISLQGYNDVRLTNILGDYRCNFHGRTCKVTTNYKRMKEFEVSFYEDGLPHLLGLHYVGKNKSGTKILSDIDNGIMTAGTIRKHHEFGPKDIKNRILLYPFLQAIDK